jgi:hypothetical protein
LPLQAEHYIAMSGIRHSLESQTEPGLDRVVFEAQVEQPLEKTVKKYPGSNGKYKRIQPTDTALETKIRPYKERRGNREAQQINEQNKNHDPEANSQRPKRKLTVKSKI